MSLRIDANLYEIQNRLNITSERMQTYSDKSVDDIIDAEAAQGNTKALEFARQLESDPATLIKTYGMDSPTVKHQILSQVPEQQLPELLELLSDEDLRMGLYFFSEEKLLNLMQKEASIEEVVNAAAICFPIEKIIEMMPDKELNQFVINKEIDPEFMKKNLQMMPPEVLAAMIETATGEPVMEEDPIKLVDMLYGLDKETYQEAMISMDPDAKKQMVYNMQKQNPEVMCLFSAEAYTDMMGTLQKPDMMAGTMALQTDTLINMNAELPPELLSIVLTQMDTKDFAKMLIEKHPELLNQLIG
jgi:hypothetical protein